MTQPLGEADELDRPDASGRVDLSFLGNVFGYQLRRAQLAVFDDFIRSFADHSLRPSQFGALVAIERNPGSSQAAIAQSLGIKRSNFVKIVDEFERRNFVARREVAGDRRANALFLTDAGTQAIAEFREIHHGHEARIGALIGDARERKLFLEQLLRLCSLRQTSAD